MSTFSAIPGPSEQDSRERGTECSARVLVRWCRFGDPDHVEIGFARYIHILKEWKIEGVFGPSRVLEWYGMPCPGTGYIPSVELAG